MKKELTETQMDDLCSATYQLLQTMGTIYGSDPAYEMFQKFEEVLGPEVKGNLFLKMLNSEYSSGLSLRFTFTRPNNSQDVAFKINLIRAIRAYCTDNNHVTRYGLKEAKDIVDAAEQGNSVVYFTDSSKRDQFVSELKANHGKIV